MYWLVFLNIIIEIQLEDRQIIAIKCQVGNNPIAQLL